VSDEYLYIGQEEKTRVNEVLDSQELWRGLDGGPVAQFEDEFAARHGRKYVHANSSGTCANEAALAALGLEPGDEVIVTPRTFIASASSAVIHGIKPVFADVDRDSGNITAESIESSITSKTKAIIAVHLAGWPCDMDPILDVARRYNLKVIEDCAQSHGATYKGRPCGSLGDVAAWSFCQDKIMTTGGEGGMLTTNNKNVWKKAWSFKDHGKCHDSVHNSDHKLGFKWLHESFGTNFRMTEMQAAIGRKQLTKLHKWVSIRRRNAAILENVLSELPGVRIPIPDPEIGHSYYKFYVYIISDNDRPWWSRDRIMMECSERGIPCYSGCCSEIYMEKAFRNSGLQPPSRLVVAKELGETSLMFLVHPTLSEEYMHLYARSLREVFIENWMHP